MKKLALALVAASAISAANAEISTGFYLGANVTENFMTSRANVTNRTNGQMWFADAGRDRLGLGAYAGYGMVSGCMYYAGELAYQWTNNSFRFKDITGAQGFKLEDENLFNFSFRVGTKFTPSTVGYIVIGGNVGTFDLDSNVAGMNADKTRVSFAPGLGVETAATKNIRLRLEWTYDFGRAIQRTSGASFVKFHRTHSQAVKLGAAWKF